MTPEQADFRRRFFDGDDGDADFQIPPSWYEPSIRPPLDERAAARAARRAQEEAMATQRMLGIALICVLLVAIAAVLTLIF